MSRLDNPYTNRKAISYEGNFFGRQGELRAMYTRLLNGTSVSLIGERRTGKSSLMNALSFESARESLEIQENVRIAYADCQEMAGCDEETFLGYLCQQFATAMEMDEPVVPSRGAFKLLARAAHMRGLRPVLAIDEFEVLIEDATMGPEFLAFLRSWTSGTETPIVIASREGTVEQLTEERSTGSAFLNVFSPVYVGPLEPQDAMDLITVPAEIIGEPFDSEDIDWIRSVGGLLPFFLQIASFHLLEGRRTFGEGEKARKAAERSFTYEATPNMQYLARRLSPTERTALSHWVNDHEAMPRDGYEALIRKGILIRDPDERVFSKTFIELFSRMHNDKGNYGH